MHSSSPEHASSSPPPGSCTPLEGPRLWGVTPGCPCSGAVDTSAQGSSCHSHTQQLLCSAAWPRTGFCCVRSPWDPALWLSMFSSSHRFRVSCFPSNKLFFCLSDLQPRNLASRVHLAVSRKPISHNERPVSRGGFCSLQSPQTSNQLVTYCL